MKNKISVNRFNSGYSMFGGFRKVGTTLNFGELTPVMCDEVLENDSWRIQFSNHFDIAPMACRTFADIYYNQGAFSIFIFVVLLATIYPFFQLSFIILFVSLKF